jgi:hypothetical protein
MFGPSAPLASLALTSILVQAVFVVMATSPLSVSLNPDIDLVEIKLQQIKMLKTFSPASKTL